YYYPYPYPYYVPADDPPAYVSSYSSYGPTSSTYASSYSSYAPTDNGYAGSSRLYNNSVADDSAPQPSSAPAPESDSNVNYLTIHEASYPRPARSSAMEPNTTPGSYRSSYSAASQLPPLRPAVQNVIRALLSMPPAARQRQIDSGRYSNLTPQELQIVRYVTGIPPA
ncbi:MAG TPA: hypothetical protein VMU45_07095, partial [Candidatus Eisenbacteria bacterium]|nr:hypothetical protein [Candidatus Eisenbacteria bacterium]